MDTVGFLRRILPPTGLYVASRLVQGKFRNHPVGTLEELAAMLLEFDSQGLNAYHACAAYREASVTTKKPDGSEYEQLRVIRNVRAVRALWCDLDVKPDTLTAYPTQEAAVDGLLAFVQATALPMPLVVSSGNGIHCYWTLMTAVHTDEWKPVAELLKAAAKAYEFHADLMCTGDAARVLRSIGTWNRKDEHHPKPVELVLDAPDYELATLKALLERACKSVGALPATAVKHTVGGDPVSAAFAIERDFPPCSALKVAERCKQMAKIQETKGNVAEPYFYAAVQLMCNTVEGDTLIHQWSTGNPGYDPNGDWVPKKIAQIRDQGMGPTLCTTFDSRNPGGCTGCPHFGKIASPAQLGAIVVHAAPPVVQVAMLDGTIAEVALPNPPAPYSRSEKGGLYFEKEGITHKLYDYDFYPIELSYDEGKGHEMARFRHFLPIQGWKEFSVRSALIAKPVDFEILLRDQHVVPLMRNEFMTMTDNYLRTLRNDRAIGSLVKTQGWKNDTTEFTLGTKHFSKGKVAPAGSAGSVGTWIAPIHSKGSLQAWADTTAVFQDPALAQHAFYLLGAFACPLLAMGNLQGLTFCSLGETNAGKSTMGRFVSSVYGHPEKGWIAKDDTPNARGEHLGTLGSLPAYIDEITTMKAEDVRSLVYLVSTGKWRGALGRDRQAKAAAEWSTILFTSSNDSLFDKLQAANSEPQAEAMRLFEMRFPNIPWFEAQLRGINIGLHMNYGHAGELYIRGLVEHRDLIASQIHPLIESAIDEFKMEGRERFWATAIALALYGGAMARDWGIIKFDPDVVKPWLMTETQRMRGDVEAVRMTAAQILGQYLNETVSGRLVVRKISGAFAGITGRLVPHDLCQRFESDTNELYISRTHLYTWLAKKHHDKNKLRTELIRLGVLIGGDTRKRLDANVDLGGGTDLTSANVPCWKIDTSHPALRGVISA